MIASSMVNGDYSQHLLEILSGPHGHDYFKVAQAVDIFSRYGVIFILFLIGLETSLADMRKVGRESTLVAIIGVVIPFGLGLVMTLILLPEIELQVDLFIAATLVATSIGIDIVEAKIFISFLFVMTLAWFANLIGLATIIGAFTAGVILHDGYFRHWGDESKHSLSIKELIAPFETILVPIFFVLMGIQVKLETLRDPHVILIAVLLTIIAITGKQNLFHSVDTLNKYRIIFVNYLVLKQYCV
ncbi:MAG: cation:proton antiporter [Woeseiaceae bacterium]